MHQTLFGVPYWFVTKTVWLCQTNMQLHIVIINFVTLTLNVILKHSQMGMYDNKVDQYTYILGS